MKIVILKIIKNILNKSSTELFPYISKELISIFMQYKNDNMMYELAFVGQLAINYSLGRKH